MEPDEPQRREVLSPDQLAEYLGCGRTTAYALLRERRIPSFTVGRLRRIRRRDVDSYVSELLACDSPHARQPAEREQDAVARELVRSESGG
jgi:excisionase family DNA binding protein